MTLILSDSTSANHAATRVLDLYWGTWGGPRRERAAGSNHRILVSADG